VGWGGKGREAEGEGRKGREVEGEGREGREGEGREVRERKRVEVSTFGVDHFASQRGHHLEGEGERGRGEGRTRRRQRKVGRREGEERERENKGRRQTFEKILSWSSLRLENRIFLGGPCFPRGEVADLKKN
jgi:hypothetical protein